MKISARDVSHIANLASLELPEDEIQQLTVELNGILSYMEKLDELDTQSIKPTFHVLPISAPLRQDRVRPSLEIREVLANAPAHDGGCFSVPKFVED